MMVIVLKNFQLDLLLLLSPICKPFRHCTIVCFLLSRLLKNSQINKNIHLQLRIYFERLLRIGSPSGSGKTHTMGTTFDSNLNDEKGVIPPAVHEIFEMIARMPNADFTVQCS